MVGWRLWGIGTITYVCRYEVGEFNAAGSVIVDYNTTTPLLDALRIVTHSESDSWIILNEIHFRTA
jgi:hypothetical protein